jgi:hypothetical protein
LKMAIAVAASRQTVANAYAGLGAYIGVCTGDPGTTNTPANEATGGGYVRVATTWTPGSTGTEAGSAVTVNVPAGTFTYILLASASSGNTMVDKTAVASTTMSAAGQLVITPNYTQT